MTFEQVEAILNNLTARVTVLELLGSNCLEKIAAAVDFGNSPFGEVYVGLNQLVKFNRVKLNLGGGYNISTGIFTAPG
ncbi:hypothetical protein V6M80_11575, partial [Enterococcus faecium]|uniref:hypothetical protein n=1 Tax=Enterococcus faecium TaxID=1352 RepID=UPI002FEE73BD